MGERHPQFLQVGDVGEQDLPVPAAFAGVAAGVVVGRVHALEVFGARAVMGVVGHRVFGVSSIGFEYYP